MEDNALYHIVETDDCKNSSTALAYSESQQGVLLERLRNFKTLIRIWFHKKRDTGPASIFQRMPRQLERYCAA